MLNDEARSLKALSIALDRLQNLPDEKIQLELNQAVKQLRLIVRQCSPLLEFYNEALDQLQENPDSTPRNKLLNPPVSSVTERPNETFPKEIASAKRPNERQPGLHPDISMSGDDFNELLPDQTSLTQHQDSLSLLSQDLAPNHVRKTPLEIFEENDLVGCFEEEADSAVTSQSVVIDYLSQKQKQGRL
jgi:type VI protein secretion system component VasK